MRRVLMTVMLGAALLVVAAGCGSSSSSSSSSGGSGASSSSGVKDLESQLTGSKLLSQKQAACVAGRAEPKMSAKGLKVAADSSSQMTDLSKADQAALFDSFTACVTSAEMAPVISKGLSSGSGQIDASTAACFTQKLVAKYPKSGDMFKAMLNTSAGGDVVSIMTACMPAGALSPSTTG